MASDTGNRLYYSRELCALFSITDRSLRTWVTRGRFPAPDGNFCGRHFWLASTIEKHRADLLAGKYRAERRPRPSAPEAA